MQALERAIESLTDPSVGVADALRGLLVVSRRISAESVTTWLKAELDGYQDGEEVPSYRVGDHFPVAVRFDGYGGVRTTRRMAQRELPPELSLARGPWSQGIFLRQPIAELAALCSEDQVDEPQIQLPLGWLATYRALVEEGRVPHMEMMVANHAAVLVPITNLRGVVDRVKSAALDLALGLEDVSVDVGSAGGPTVENEPALERAVTIHMQQIYATNSSVVIGDNATVTHVQVGDVDGLLSAARSLLSAEGVEALARALDRDGGEPAAETRSMLARVRGGAYVLAGGMTGNGAYDGLVELLGMVFPGFG